MGPPPLWSVAGEGGLCSGLEGSVGCGGRGSAPRPDPAKEEGREESQNWTEQSCYPPNWPSPLLPRLGDGGTSSFGLRLRTGERCSLRGRSEGHRKVCDGLLRACCLSPALLPSLQCAHAHTDTRTHTVAFRASPHTHPFRGCSSGGGARDRNHLSEPCSWPSGSLISQPCMPPVVPSKDQSHEGSPRAHPFPSVLKHTWRCLPLTNGGL